MCLQFQWWISAFEMLFSASVEKCLCLSGRFLGTRDGADGAGNNSICSVVRCQHEPAVHSSNFSLTWIVAANLEDLKMSVTFCSLWASQLSVVYQFILCSCCDVCMQGLLFCSHPTCQSDALHVLSYSELLQNWIRAQPWTCNMAYPASS